LIFTSGFLVGQADFFPQALFNCNRLKKLYSTTSVVLLCTSELNNLEVIDDLCY